MRAESAEKQTLQSGTDTHRSTLRPHKGEVTSAVSTVYYIVYIRDVYQLPPQLITRMNKATFYTSCWRAVVAGSIRKFRAVPAVCRRSVCVTLLFAGS